MTKQIIRQGLANIIVWTVLWAVLDSFYTMVGFGYHLPLVIGSMHILFLIGVWAWLETSQPKGDNNANK